MARFTIFALFVLVVGQAIAWKTSGSIFAALRDLGLLLLLIPAAYYLVMLSGSLSRRLLWTVRNRLIISYLLVGLVPPLLLGLIGWLSMAVVFKQLSALYLQSELQSISDFLRESNTRLQMDFAADGLGAATDPTVVESAAASQIEGLGSIWGTPRLEVREWHPAADDGPTAPTHWIQESFDGFVLDDGQLQLTSAAVVDGGRNRWLLALSLPFGEDLLAEITRRTSIELQVIPPGRSFAPSLARFGRQHERLAVSGAHFFTPVNWTTGLPQQEMSILLSVPISTLIHHFFARGGTLLGLLTALLLLFVVVELAAVIVASTMARSVTRSVADIYGGLQRVQEGDFGVRIPGGKKDQLGAVADSFNRMAASIQRLMQEVSEKEWLAKEVEIATQVQQQLFPQQLPSVAGLEIAATCIPARRVSGDYYDFIPFADDRIDIIIGDISGKGISAALTMASTQSSIRSQLLNHPLEDSDRLCSTLEAVSRQLYHSSRPQTFSTAVLAHYDAPSGSLLYCNAGHNPPLLFSGDAVRRLETGGTVAGLVQVWDYTQESLELSSGDVLLLYTDGVTEAAAAGGEEFGEDRLIELVRTNTFLTAQDIQELIVSVAFDFCGDSEQADDITVVCLKVV